MHGRERTGTGVVTESAVQAVLRRGSQAALGPDEERTIRMRVGAGLPLGARLERIATASDTEIELLAIEVETYLKLKERRAAARPTTAARVAAQARPVASTSRAKEKIIRALRKKG
jgi:hypothetical protein